MLAYITFCLCISQVLLSIAPYSSPTTIDASGTITENAVEPTIIGKHIVAYIDRFTDETIEFIASNFDVVDTGFDKASAIGKVKALNPDIIVVGYRDIMAMHPRCEDWEEVDPHEDWFLHDLNGDRLVNRKYGWYAMDVGNLGWRTHYANVVKAKLDTYPAFDGVFADDVWEWYDYNNAVWTVDPALVPPEIQKRWHNDMVGMIQYVKSVIGSKLLIINTSDWTGDYLQYSDGMMFEGFIHGSWADLDDFKRTPLNHVDVLANLSTTGKYFLAQSGAKIPDNPTQADIDKANNIMIYCLASYLLGVNGQRSSFGFNILQSSNDYSVCYRSEFDAPLGSPINDYYPLASVYSRDFEKGKVLVNFTTSPYTVGLDSEYKKLDGQMVSNVTLDARSGIILLRP